MDENTIRYILRELENLKATSVRWRRGVVTDDSPLTVSLGSSDEAIGVKSLDGLVPTIGDHVAVLAWGHDQIVIGTLS